MKIFLEEIIPKGSKKIFGIKEVNEAKEDLPSEEEEAGTEEVTEPAEEEEETGEAEEVELPYGGEVTSSGRKRVVITFKEAPPTTMKIADREKFMRQIASAVRAELKIKETGSKEQKATEARKAAKEEGEEE